MKQFFKFMLASIAGTVVSLFLLFFILIVVIGGAISAAMSDIGKGNNTNINDNSILHIDFREQIVDRGPADQFNLDFGPFKTASPLGLNDIVKSLEKAKTDDRITGIFLDLSFIQAGMASVKEIRDALVDFKSSGKWIISYSEVYSQKAYYLASVADEIYVYPQGVLDFRGLSVDITFLKGTLEKLEIEPQIIRGSNNKFKSAIEPLILKEMSQANRLQTNQWLSALWGTMLKDISGSRGTSEGALQTIADGFLIQEAPDAVEKGLATATKYYDEVLADLKTRTETDFEDDLNSVTLRKYIKAKKPSSGDFKLDFKQPKIAVIYASGGISSGEGDDESIGSETLAKAIREARRDSTIKAIVLRVNSPGGSALASDVIWRETKLAKEAKPFVVSMGDVAASGGYYISAAADKIFAMPNTITGSIGVFGVIPNMKGFFNNKLGMTFDGVKTAKYADFPEVSRPLTDGEFAIIQNSVDRTYNTFLERVSEGRGMKKEVVDSIGQGRVWSGTDALAIGLIDELGNLEDAIAAAAEMAGIEDYRRKELPTQEDPLKKFMKELQAQASIGFLKMQFGDDMFLINRLKEVKSIREMQGVQARIPFEIVVE